MYTSALSSGVNGPKMSITSSSGPKPTTYALKITTGLSSGVTASASPALSVSTPTIASVTNPPSATGNAPSNKSGLSKGAIAGIAIGGVVGLVALLTLGIMLWRTKRKMSSLESRVPLANGDEYVKPQGVTAVPPYQKKDDHVHEMESTGLIELEPQQPPQELDGAMIDRTNK
jgi:hypothetical protein